MSFLYTFTFWNFLLLFSDYVVIIIVINEHFKLEMTADAGLYFFIEYTKLYCYFYRTSCCFVLCFVIYFDRYWYLPRGRFSLYYCGCVSGGLSRCKQMIVSLQAEDCLVASRGWSVASGGSSSCRQLVSLPAADSLVAIRRSL